MDTDIFKTRLLQLRAEMEAALAAGADAGAPVELDQTTQGRLSRMDAMQQQQMSLAATRRRQDKIRAIDAALTRIAEGDFGYCASCGEEIGDKRLELDPTIQICVECAR